MAHLLMMENNCANLYWNPSKILGVKVQTKIWPSSVTLTLANLNECFKWHIYTWWWTTLSNYLKSILNCSYGLDKFGQTYAHTHIQWTVVVTTMSHSPQASSAKINFEYFRLIKQTGTISPSHRMQTNGIYNYLVNTNIFKKYSHGFLNLNLQHFRVANI